MIFFPCLVNFIVSHDKLYNNYTAIYLPTAIAIQTEDTLFENNLVYNYTEAYGGGTVYLGFVPEGTTAVLRGNWTGNKVMYPFKVIGDNVTDGSEHGEGGAIKIDWLEGHANINGHFIGNSAPDGAAIQVMVCSIT